MKKNVCWIALPVFALMFLSGFHQVYEAHGLFVGAALMLLGGGGFALCAQQVELFSGKVVAPALFETPARRVKVEFTSYEFEQEKATPVVAPKRGNRVA